MLVVSFEHFSDSSEFLHPVLYPTSYYISAFDLSYAPYIRIRVRTRTWIRIRMDGWVDGWIDGWMNGLMDKHIDRWMDGRKDIQIDRQIDRWIDGYRSAHTSDKTIARDSLFCPLSHNCAGYKAISGRWVSWLQLGQLGGVNISTVGFVKPEQLTGPNL